MTPIKIRAAHIEGIRSLFSTDRDEYVKGLIEEGYIQNPDDDFANFSWGLRKLIENPEQEFQIVVDEADFVCENCPKSEKCNYIPRNVPKSVGTAFGKVPSDDKLVLETYGLQEGRAYSFKELRKAALF